jgi:hypothetical protein
MRRWVTLFACVVALYMAGLLLVHGTAGMLMRAGIIVGAKK